MVQLRSNYFLCAHRATWKADCPVSGFVLFHGFQPVAICLSCVQELLDYISQNRHAVGGLAWQNWEVTMPKT